MANSQPPRLRRADSFLGIHFDFHANDESAQIGLFTTPKMIEEVIRKVHPDYIQCDCKGHRGYSSYPTRVGYPAPGLVADGLRVWRDVTAAHGVALYMHYSGVWDAEAVRHHPEWAVMNGDGVRDPNQTAPLGPYVDQLLIPQLKELSDAYGVDGVWVDGDCWATKPDYSPDAVRAFQQATGILSIPKKADDPGWFEFRQFFREAFRRYVRHYVDELHRHDASFQIASNWAFSSFMPEPVSADVDFISGDFTLQNSVNSARLEGRCMARQGKPWDLMAWGFCSKLFQNQPEENDTAFSTKTAVQLEQEAAIVLGLGGGFQVYFTQRQDGAVRLYQMDVMAEVASFCRARQAYCHKAEAVPQVALLHLGQDYYRKNQALFTPGNVLAPLRGALQGLLDNQLPVEILSEHTLKGRLEKYGLIVLPEVDSLDESLRGELLDYCWSGGSLLLITPQTAAHFEKELHIKLTGVLARKTDRFLEYRGAMIGLNKIAVQGVRLGKGAVGLGRLHVENDAATPAKTAASIADYGQGKIGALYFGFGEGYLRGQTSLARDLLGDVARNLYPHPSVEVRGSHLVDVTLNTRDGRLAINLVNLSGPHANQDVYTYDEIPPVGPLEIRLKMDSRPRSVELQPGSRKVRWTWKNGSVHLSLPRVDIQEIIWVEPR